MKLTLEQANEMMARDGGSLYLSDTQITELPENLTVGGWLDLRGTQITALPENLTVGGRLDLRGTQITELPENLTVGGSLDLRGTQITDTSKVVKLKNGDYKEGQYIYCDGILTHVKCKRKVGEYDLYVGKTKGKNVVSDGELYAHCTTLRDGIADLLFKRAADRGAEQYKDLKLDSVMTRDEAITMYRIITGACRAGTERFVSSLKELKDTYTVREVLEITEGQYNADKIAEFFNWEK